MKLLFLLLVLKRFLNMQIRHLSGLDVTVEIDLSITKKQKKKQEN